MTLLTQDGPTFPSGIEAQLACNSSRKSGYATFSITLHLLQQRANATCPQPGGMLQLPEQLPQAGVARGACGQVGQLCRPLLLQHKEAAQLPGGGSGEGDSLGRGGVALPGDEEIGGTQPPLVLAQAGQETAEQPGGASAAAPGARSFSCPVSRAGSGPAERAFQPPPSSVSAFSEPKRPTVRNDRVFRQAP